MGANPHANGGLLLKDLKLPDFRDYAVDVPKPGKVSAEATRVLGHFLRDVMKLNMNQRNFRVMGPDETASNRLDALFEVTDRTWMADRVPEDDHLSPEGRVMEILSEHTCQGWMEGYLLYLLTSHVWRQDHNGFSRQDPGFIDHVVNKKADVVRVYFPPDANALLSVADHCLQSRNYVNVIVAGKQPHNPPADGGYKYNPPNGGPAETDVTGWIQKRANEYLENKHKGVKRIPYEKAFKASTTHPYDFMNLCVEDLKNIVDFDLVRGSGIHLGIDPLGGAGVHYWDLIRDKYRLNLAIISEEVDPTFRFMTVDWDGKIRMDPSSEYAMQRLIKLKEKFDVTFACDTDHDRHALLLRGAAFCHRTIT